MVNGERLAPQFGIQNWPYPKPAPPEPPVNNLGLRLMPSTLNREPYLMNQNLPIEFFRESPWINRGTNIIGNETKILYPFPQNHNYLFKSPEPNNTLQVLEQPNFPPNDDEPIYSVTNEPQEEKEVVLKKRSRGQSNKLPKPSKKPKKEAVKSSRRNDGKSEELVINGIGLDLAEIPTPVCSCTGKPHQCYRWGVGGWQSACCTKSMSMYPLPLSMKRRGARIPGRKMSLGAFKKLLEKLAGEGENLSYPIDLKPYWAKHGTNKFVTIR